MVELNDIGHCIFPCQEPRVDCTYNLHYVSEKIMINILLSRILLLYKSRYTQQKLIGNIFVPVITFRNHIYSFLIIISKALLEDNKFTSCFSSSI